MKNIGIIFASRAGHIKRFPLVWALKKELPNSSVHLIDLSTEERSQVESNFSWFGFKKEDFIRPKSIESSGDIIRALAEGIEQIGQNISYFITLGDTKATLLSTKWLKEENFKVIRFEAGYRARTNQNQILFEKFRKEADHLADLLIAPTEISRNNLIEEKINPVKILKRCGHPLVDALMYTVQKIQNSSQNICINDRFILFNLSKIENFENEQYKKVIINSIKATSQDRLCFCLVHENKLVSNAFNELSGLPNIKLSPRVSFFEMISLKMNPKCQMVVSDAGGCQEESIILGKPTLIIRPSGELDRPELETLNVLQSVSPSNQADIESLITNFTKPKDTNQQNTEHKLGSQGISERLIKDILQLLKGGDLHD